MKKTLKLLAFLTLVLFIFFSVLTCDNTDSNSNGNSNSNNNNNNNNNNGNGNGNGNGNNNGNGEEEEEPESFKISAMEFVSKMGVGWNLGNTLDAPDNFSSSATLSNMETLWTKVTTTEDLIKAVKDAGFNTIRIPVSWKKAANPNNNYTIRFDWMYRVQEIVDYAIDNGMYVILNTHHDSGHSSPAPIFKFDNEANTAASIEAFTQIWEQIAELFRDYDEKLIFEPLNEPRTPDNDWSGNAEKYENLNRHYQAFVDTVRENGSNNRFRFFIFNTYAASRSANPMNGLVLPEDTANDKLIVSYHAYVPDSFAFGGLPGTTRGDTVNWSVTGREGRDATDITAPMDRFYEKFVTEGIPVIIGETGATNKDNEAARAAWAEYYVKSAKERGMRVVIWDNAKTASGSSNNNELYGLLDRLTKKIIFEELMAGLLKGLE